MAEEMSISESQTQELNSSLTQDEDKTSKPNRLPQTRVRNMMKMDPDLHIVSQESVFLLTRAAELFVGHVTKKAYKSTLQGKRKTLQRKDLDFAVCENDEMAFLEGALE